MITGLLFIGLLILVISGSCRKKEKSGLPSEKLFKEDSIDKEALSMARAGNRPLIEEWIKQVNESPSRPGITYWDFWPGSAEQIRFTLLHESTVRKGSLHFRRDLGKPRVSLMTYEDEEGKQKSMKGYIIKGFSQMQLGTNLKAEISDAAKIAYINDVATKALMQGGAVFDIRKYEKLTKKDFDELWTRRKVKALCRMLVDEKIFASAKEKGGSLIQVTPVTSPE